MKAVIQRVKSASVSVDDKIIGEIATGFLILLGVEQSDTQDDLNYLVKKTIGLRIFKDDNKNMNLSIKDVGGEALVVSQFTLCADTSRGRRPSFIKAANPEEAEKGTIRYNFATSIGENAVHGSDSDENAVIEAGFFFSAFEQV